MKKKLFGLLAMTSLFLVGCGDTVTQDFSDAKGDGKVSFLMRDNVTGELLSDVSLTLIADGKKAVVDATDSTGLSVFSGLSVGTQLFRIEKEGYAGKIVSITLSDGSSDVPRVMDVAEEVRLAKNGAQISGKVYYKDKYGNLNVLADAIVDLYLDEQAPGTWINGHFAVATDEKGVYSFDSLPEDVPMDVFVRSLTIGNEVYAATTTRSISNLKNGEARILDKITMEVDGDELLLLSDNLDSVSESEALELIFSTQIDTTLITLNDITVKHEGSNLGISYAWSADNHKLTIHSATGKWYVGTQDLTLKIEDISGLTYNKTLSFSPASASAVPANASGLRIKANVFGKDTNLVNSNTASMTLLWTIATGAEGYGIYTKSKKDSNYVLFTEVSSGKDSSFALNTTSMFDSADVVTFMVLAFNSKGYADISKAPTITVKDSIRPRLISSPGEFAAMSLMTDLQLTNTNNLDSIEADSVTFTFTEVMDTTKAAKLAYTNNSGSTIETTNLLLYWRWISTTQARVIIGVMPNKTAAPIDANIDVDVSELKDVAGNLAQVQQGDWTRILVDNIP